jgi:hypothetical protein
MTSAPVHFLILCIETYKVLHNMSGEEVLDLFVPKGFNTPPFRAVKKVLNP